MPVLQAVNVSHRYTQTSPTQFSAIENVNIEIENGELVGIIGHTGSGKSTLVQHFNGLLKPTQGQIYLKERIYGSQRKQFIRHALKWVFVFSIPNISFLKKLFIRISLSDRRI